MHCVAVPNHAAEETVRQFGCYTVDLNGLADWLAECGVKIVAMESTGVYWIPLYELLERRGFEVMLVDARHVKGVHGRKSDVLDCQWLQQLLSYGLLRAAFRPHDQFCALRELTRIRSRTLRDQGRSVQHMQKAMTLVTDRRNGATDVRRIGASNRWVKRASRGVTLGWILKAFAVPI